MSQADVEKLSSWENRPDNNTYLDNKKVYDNPKYFNQETGKEIWPGENKDPNVDGFLDGKYTEKDLPKGTVIDRYGGNNGTFFGRPGTPIENRAMSPNSDFGKYNRYEVTRSFPVREGKIAPWFDQPGGGLQDKIDPNFEKELRSNNPNTPLIDSMIRMGYLRRL